MTAERDLLSTADVSDMTLAPIGTVRYWRSIGYGPRSVKLGKRVVYRRSEVQQFVDRQFDEAGKTTRPKA